MKNRNERNTARMTARRLKEGMAAGAIIAAAACLCACGAPQEDEGNVTTTEQTREENEETPGARAEAEYVAGIKNNDYYIIRNKISGLVMTAKYFGLREDFPILMREYGEKEQDLSMIWRVVESGSGFYRMQNMATEDRYLTVKSSSVEAGVSLCISPEEETDRQLFELKDISSSDSGQLCRVLSKPGSFAAQPEAGAREKETTVVINDAGDADYQIWEFVRVGDGAVALPQMLSLSGETANWSCPEIARYGDIYYSFVMLKGIVIRSSPDLRKWTRVGSVFPSAGSEAWMSDPVQGVPGGKIWAPGIYKVGDTWCVYYCMSTSGSRHSAIGLATNTTLDPKEEGYEWVDQGLVLHSYKEDNYNAIDPCVITDQDGQPWLIYGSYWSGIMMRKLDPETLMLDEKDNTVHNLAAAQKRKGPEAGYMIYRDGYYYLFCACGSFSTGYWNGVGRSESVTGPFTDRDGIDMMKEGASPVTEYRDGFIRCGHASILQDMDGSYYHVTEYFIEFEDGTMSNSLVGISQMFWTRDGWPVTATTPGVLSLLSGD